MANSCSTLDPTKKNLDTFGACDFELWTKLRGLVDGNARCIHCAERARVLPASTLYYRPALIFLRDLSRDVKETIREHWLRQALRATAGADLVCLDPDNGIRWDSSKMFHQDGPKFTYISDLRAFWDRGQSLVVYQHTDRIAGSVQNNGDRLRDTLGTDPFRSGITGAQPASSSSCRKRRTGNALSSGLPECWPGRGDSTSSEQGAVANRAAKMLGAKWVRPRAVYDDGVAPPGPGI